MPQGRTVRGIQGFAKIAKLKIKEKQLEKRLKEVRESIKALEKTFK